MFRFQGQLGQEFGRNLRFRLEAVRKASLHARPTAPALARIAALADFEKVVVDAGMEVVFVCFATLPACASWASLSNTAILPSLSMLHLLESAAATKLPWHPSGRGRRRNLGKRT